MYDASSAPSNKPSESAIESAAQQPLVNENSSELFDAYEAENGEFDDQQNQEIQQQEQQQQYDDVYYEQQPQAQPIRKKYTNRPARFAANPAYKFQQQFIHPQLYQHGYYPFSSYYFTPINFQAYTPKLPYQKFFKKVKTKQNAELKHFWKLAFLKLYFRVKNTIYFGLVKLLNKSNSVKKSHAQVTQLRLMIKINFQMKFTIL